jgi:nucleotide-binding universal stress UspA family protein
MKIIVGNVDTDERWAALEWAMEEAVRRDAEVIITTSMNPRGSLDVQAEKVLAYREELEEVERRLAEAGIAHAIHKYMRGNSPAEDVLLDAAEEGADMIVIGIPRKSPGGKAVLRGGAEEILLNADCPVMVVKGD